MAHPWYRSALVPSLLAALGIAGADVSFDGPTRASALSDFEDWLKGEFGLDIGGLHAEVAYLIGRSYQGVSARLGLRF